MLSKWEGRITRPLIGSVIDSRGEIANLHNEVYLPADTAAVSLRWISIAASASSGGNLLSEAEQHILEVLSNFCLSRASSLSTNIHVDGCIGIDRSGCDVPFAHWGTRGQTRSIEESSGVADAIQELFTILDGEVGASLSSCEKAGETFPVAAAVPFRVTS